VSGPVLLRRALFTVGTGLVVAFACLSHACVIADPPADLPRVPLRRPVIVSTIPPRDHPLGTWPVDGQFILNVEVQDPTLPIYTQGFVDYRPGRVGQEDLYEQYVEVSDVPTLDGGLRTVTITLDAPLTLGRCHTVEILVAQTPFQSPHLPREPGANVAYWTYSPTGNFDGCSFFDAGPFLDGSFPDTSTDAPGDVTGVQ
jgi:hypothetical protein